MAPYLWFFWPYSPDVVLNSGSGPVLLFTRIFSCKPPQLLGLRKVVYNHGQTVYTSLFSGIIDVFCILPGIIDVF
jgi:hypothetical protein